MHIIIHTYAFTFNAQMCQKVYVTKSHAYALGLDYNNGHSFSIADMIFGISKPLKCTIPNLYILRWVITVPFAFGHSTDDLLG